MQRLLASLLLLAPTPAAAQSADLILHNGTVLTMDDAAPRARAVAVRDGRILAVGDDESVLAKRGPETEVMDLEGRALLPGFVDAHGHVTGGGLQALSANLLAPPDGEVTDIPSLQATLRDWMEENPSSRL
ncbi:MAG: amidohydrolase family protein, partial [Planctomycetota bacterium]